MNRACLMLVSLGTVLALSLPLTGFADSAALQALS